MAIRFVYQPRKAIAAVSYLAQADLPDLTKGKIDKLLFLADKLHLVSTGRPITGDCYAALPHGPVPSNTDNLLDAFEAGEYCIDCLQLVNEVRLDARFQYPHFVKNTDSPTTTQDLSVSDQRVLDQILRQYGSKSFSELRSITHEMPAYEKAWATRTGNRGDMNFADFFEEDSDAVAGVREEVIENCALRSVFPEPVWE